MEITLSAENNKSTISIPFVSPDFEIPLSKNKMEKFSSVKGEFSLFGRGKELREIKWSSFFPFGNTFYPDVIKDNVDPYSYVKWINAYNEKRIPIRIVITHKDNTLLNMPCTIAEFSWSLDKGCNINYSISLLEFVFVKAEKV